MKLIPTADRQTVQPQPSMYVLHNMYNHNWAYIFLKSFFLGSSDILKVRQTQNDFLSHLDSFVTAIIFALHTASFKSAA